MKTNAKMRASKKDARMSYPKEDDLRVGCKVSWYIYSNRKDAEACAKAAKHNAVIQANLGYDFGYCSPGSIETLDDGRFEVCLP